jgi:creatinine amidohydrolase
MRPKEIVSERERCPIAYIPLGPLEWHSVHLPFGTDGLNANTLALLIAERVGGVVLPPFYWGTERERSPEQVQALGFNVKDYVVGMDFPKNLLKSLYCREEFLALLVRELLGLVIDLQYELVVLVNGHGASNQIQTLERLCAEFTACSPATVLLVTAAPADEDTESIGHADALETSLMLAAYPDCVDLDELPPAPRPLRSQDWGIVDAETFDGVPNRGHTLRTHADPRLHASVERGQQAYLTMVDALERRIREML